MKYQIPEYLLKLGCLNINEKRFYFYALVQKISNYGQSEQILLKRKWKEKIAEDDRCVSLIDTDSSLNALLCPALSDLKNNAKLMSANFTIDI